MKGEKSFIKVTAGSSMSLRKATEFIWVNIWINVWNCRWLRGLSGHPIDKGEICLVIEKGREEVISWREEMFSRAERNCSLWSVNWFHAAGDPEAGMNLSPGAPFPMPLGLSSSFTTPRIGKTKRFQGTCLYQQTSSSTLLEWFGHFPQAQVGDGAGHDTDGICMVVGKCCHFLLSPIPAESCWMFLFRSFPLLLKFLTHLSFLTYQMRMRIIVLVLRGWYEN